MELGDDIAGPSLQVLNVMGFHNVSVRTAFVDRRLLAHDCFQSRSELLIESFLIQYLPPASYGEMVSLRILSLSNFPDDAFDREPKPLPSRPLHRTKLLVLPRLLTKA